MKICVFGSDGRTGVEVVNYAKKQGFGVVASVYSEGSNKYFPSDVEVKIVDIMNYDSVLEAMKGSDAVISVVGHIKESDPLVQTKGISNMVKAMNELNLKRLISLTGTGARVENDKPSIVDLVLNSIVKFIDPNRINDGVQHVKVLRNSNLDWTIVRVLKLSKKDADVFGYKLTEGGPAELQTSRKKVAKVIVDLINDDKYIGKFPVISG